MSANTSARASGLSVLSEIFPGFEDRVRMDRTSKRFSTIDVVGIVAQLSDSSHVSRYIKKISNDHPDISNKIERIRINGKGPLTPVMTFSDTLELIMVVPGRRAGGFRYKFADYLCRMCSGDQTLSGEITNTNAATNEIRRDIIMQGVPDAHSEYTPHEKELLRNLKERKLKLEKSNETLRQLEKRRMEPFEMYMVRMTGSATLPQ